MTSPAAADPERLAQVRAAFVDPQEFWSSPLYRRLSAVVAGEPFLVGLAAAARPGQGPTFAFFGAVHAVLLGGVEEPLAAYYPSVRGDAALAPDDAAGPALLAFARRHEDALRAVLSTRLVQTNHPRRAAALRLGLTVVAAWWREAAGTGAVPPVHVLEIGTSAGLVLRQGSYGYRLAGRRFGRSGSPVQLDVEWRGAGSVPDLDDVPAVASLTGIDLEPLDPGSGADRRWLEALVWPENREQAALLHRALDLAARVPVTVLAGDAVDRCPDWQRQVPPGEPRVVFHCATRMHVPAGRRAAFDAAVAALGADGPLFHLAVEGDGLVLTGPDGRTSIPYDVDGHLAWVAPRVVGNAS